MDIHYLKLSSVLHCRSKTEFFKKNGHSERGKNEGATP
jgi:hypothetical protein